MLLLICFYSFFAPKGLNVVRKIERNTKLKIMKIRKVTVEFIIETEINWEVLERHVKQAIEREIPRAEKIEIRVY